MAKSASVPLAPLEGIVKSRVLSEEGGVFNDQIFAEEVGCSSRAIGRWRSEDRQGGGRIPWHSADAAAVKLSMLPIEIWGDEWLLIDRGCLVWFEETDDEGNPDYKDKRAIESALRQIGRVLQAERDAMLARAV